MDNLKIVFSEPKIVLMTINGSFNKHINLEMLCITIFPNKCIDLGITKFVGFNKIYFYNPIYTKHNDDNKYFYNQCSFDFIDKSTFKLFNNGTFIVTGTLNNSQFQLIINKILSLINTTKYIYLKKSIADKLSTDKLALIYDMNNCFVQTHKIALANYSIELFNFEFNKYKVSNIDTIVDKDEDFKIESITDIFKYSSVSIKFNNIDGNIDFYKNKTIISVQNGQHNFDKLYSFFCKYRMKLISIPMNKNVQKFSFLVCTKNLCTEKTNNEKYKSKKVNNLVENIFERLNLQDDDL
jgi:hypothetical protein